MRNPNKDRNRINSLLGAYGLGTLEDRGTITQLAYLVADHEHFRELLNCCEAAERSAMYNAMRPHLRFEAKPLDVYIAELGDLAARKQLPVVTEDGGLAPYKVPEMGTPPEPTQTELDHIQKVFDEEFAAKHLELTCAQCLKTERFHGTFKDDCVREARRAGWRYNWETNQELCPEHAT